MKKRLSEQGIPVIDVYLFGSLASGTPHHWSDIDIAVIHKPFARSHVEERRIVQQARDDFSAPVDIVCLRPEHLADQRFALSREIRERGIPV